MEARKCRRDCAYFLDTYAQVFDAQHAKDWVPFRLWLSQEDTLATIHAEQLTIILKARQLGFTWLLVGYALWSMLFHPAATVLFFSRRDDEAQELLDFRLKGMHGRLPARLQSSGITEDSGHAWRLRNGSRAMAFPTTGGRSHTASLVIVDEADHIPNLNALLNAVKPAVDGGGKMILLSTVDKAQPQSAFKKTYLGAKAKQNDYHPVFHGWRARPGRDDHWYDAQRKDIFARTGALDDLHQEYPATDAEAIAPRSLDKRIAPAWLEQCWKEQAPLVSLPESAPSIPGLLVYTLPQPGRIYVISGDPAEGNPTSDDSASVVLDALTGEEASSLSGKFQPSTFAGHVDAVGVWYNGAPALIERNNHGHAVLLWLEANGHLPLLAGHDNRVGWLSSQKGKALLYDACADAFRHKDTILHTFATLVQLQSIEGSTLRAPGGEHDDRADAYALALIGVLGVLASLSNREDEEEEVVITT